MRMMQYRTPAAREPRLPVQERGEGGVGFEGAARGVPREAGDLPWRVGVDLRDRARVPAHDGRLRGRVHADAALGGASV